ncbi:MAG: hypothetical protein KDD50_05145, partial [Bdellovibrionales bacterium]|nr:hypothetical protein [Bdellovibrionales bacterium]
IEGNQIEGGDYGIGTDGSFPLALTVGLFSAYSQDIENELGAEVMSRYPNGVVHQGIVQLEGEDYVRGQQVLLNLASRQAVQRKDESGFGENINIVNNQILNSIMGISLYRVKQSYVWKNQIESLSKGYVGVGVSDSYSIPIFENYIKNWNKGVWIVGSPQGNSEWGSSFIGMGAKPPVFSSLNRWEDVGNILVNNIWSIAIENAGYDNAVRSNQISSTEGQGQCLFINAKTTNPSMDWTTFNSDPSCNN